MCEGIYAGLLDSHLIIRSTKDSHQCKERHSGRKRSVNGGMSPFGVLAGMRRSNEMGHTVNRVFQQRPYWRQSAEPSSDLCIVKGGRGLGKLYGKACMAG